MIDKDSMPWSVDDRAKAFLATPTMKRVAKEDPDAVGYFVTLFTAGANEDIVLDTHKETYVSAMMEMES